MPLTQKEIVDLKKLIKDRVDNYPDLNGMVAAGTRRGHIARVVRREVTSIIAQGAGIGTSAVADALLLDHPVSLALPVVCRPASITNDCEVDSFHCFIYGAFWGILNIISRMDAPISYCTTFLIVNK